MKSAKIMIAVICFVSILGAVMAFKVRTFHMLYCASTSGAVCTLPAYTTLTTTFPGLGVAVQCSTAYTVTSCYTWITTTL
jgi:hypothetical protein